MTRWLTDDEQRAWRAYLRMVLIVDAEIARDLTRDSGLSMPDYHVLSALSEAPDGRKRLSELAVSMQWSASRLSHHVSRMQQRELVVRTDCESDARGAYVVITARGFEAIRRAAPDHVRSVRRNLIDLLSPAQVASLAEIGDTVIGHFERTTATATRAATGSPGGGSSRHTAEGSDDPDERALAQPGQSANDSPVNRSYAST